MQVRSLKAVAGKVQAIFRRLPLHPFIFGIYSILALLATNIDQIRPANSLRSFFITFSATVLIFVLFWLLIRDRHRVGMLASIAVLLFFLYGHVYSQIEQQEILGIMVGRHRYLIVLWAALFLLGARWVSKDLKDPGRWTATLNLIAGLLLVFPTVKILLYERSFQGFQAELSHEVDQECPLAYPDERPPDIYYIILDAYARQDVLLDLYAFDNTSFLSSLQDMGFYVAKWSYSNYSSTGISLASSLNFDYLDVLDERIYDGAPLDYEPLWPLLVGSRVRKNLECLGYQVVTFNSGYYWTGWLNADIYFTQGQSTLTRLELSENVNAFESLLIHSSGAILLTDAATLLPNLFRVDTEHPYQEHRERQLFVLETLENRVPSIQGPKFVFAHILLPHVPFVFGPNGEALEQSGAFSLGNPLVGLSTEQITQGYRDQVIFINKRIVSILSEILRASTQPPIIILQADHGYAVHEDKLHNAILNAYYLPDSGSQHLYESITPVNSFRVVFDAYFNGTYGLLEDIIYYSPHNDIYQFTVIPHEHAVGAPGK